MRKCYYVLSCAPLVSPPKGVNVLGYSLALQEGVWITLLSVPHEKKWDNYSVLETFAHEGAFASSFVTFARV